MATTITTWTSLLKPSHPIQTDLFCGSEPIEDLTAEQIAAYGTYLATMSYDKHLAESNDPVGVYFRQPVQWWVFPAGIVAGGVLPFFRWGPNHACLEENYLADHHRYYLLLNLYTNWAGFLKRDFQYVADRTDDWLD